VQNITTIDFHMKHSKTRLCFYATRGRIYDKHERESTGFLLWHQIQVASDRVLQNEVVSSNEIFIKSIDLFKSVLICPVYSVILGLFLWNGCKI